LPRTYAERGPKKKKKKKKKKKGRKGTVPSYFTTIAGRAKTEKKKKKRGRSAPINNNPARIVGPADFFSTAESQGEKKRKSERGLPAYPPLSACHRGGKKEKRREKKGGAAWSARLP